MTDTIMDKKEYVEPAMNIFELDGNPALLVSSDKSWLDDKPDTVCDNGHNPHCPVFDE